MPPEADTGAAPAKTAAETKPAPAPEATTIAAPEAPTPPPAESPPSNPPAPEPVQMTLDEFVSDAVHAGSPMELTNAFHAEQRAKPPRKASREAWNADLKSFAGRPA